MTCIIGLLDKGDIYIGADSIAFSDTNYIIRQDKKVFIKGKFLYAFSLSFRIGQILRYVFEPPFHPHDMSDMQYICSLFIDSLIDCLIDKSMIKTEDGVISSDEFEFIVGYNQQIYRIYPDFQVEVSYIDFTSCGCGANYALGAMDNLHLNNRLTPEEKIKKSLETSAKFSIVKPPFNILKLDKNMGRNIEPRTKRVRK
jgi:ATP-dependent protease HslVU (ClpYQ) peptidase subunit